MPSQDDDEKKKNSSSAIADKSKNADSNTVDPNLGNPNTNDNLTDSYAEAALRHQHQQDTQDERKLRSDTDLADVDNFCNEQINALAFKNSVNDLFYNSENEECREEEPDYLIGYLAKTLSREELIKGKGIKLRSGNDYSNHTTTQTKYTHLAYISTGDLLNYNVSIAGDIYV